MKLKKLVYIVVFVFVFISNFIVSVKGEENKSEEKKTIFFVYDNSVSMVWDTDNKLKRDWGAKAQYAVKAFCAMSNPEDTIKFYCVGDFKTEFEKYVEDSVEAIKGEGKGYSEIVDNIIFNGQTTFYSGIYQAISDIKEYDEPGEKWVVIFTDGGLETRADGKIINYPSSKVREFLDGHLKETNINFYYVNINPKYDFGKNGDNRLTSDNENMTFYYLADKENATVLDSILSITEKIYGKRQYPKEQIKIDKNDEGKWILKADFDIPVSDVQLLLHTEMKGEETISFENVIKDKNEYYEIQSEAKSDNISIKGPYGIIMQCDELLKRDEESKTYSMEIEIPSNKVDYAIYYTPKAVAQVFIEASDNSELLKDGSYVEGNYNIDIKLFDEETNERIDVTNSYLLANESFHIIVNDKEYNKKIGQTISEALDQGEVEIKVETPWDDRLVEERIMVGDNLANYTLQLSTEKEIFYYNRFDEKENCIIVNIMDGEENVTNRFQIEDLKIEFQQDGKVCKDIVCETEFGASGEEIRIYPKLKKQNDKTISGDITCNVSLKMDSDYYKESVICSEEQFMKMDVEDELLQIEIEEKKVKSLCLLWIWSPVKIDINYRWDGEDVDWHDLDEIKNTVCVVYEEGEEETKSNKGYVEIAGKIRNYLETPDSIKITAEGTYTAHGETVPAYDTYSVYIDEISLGVKITVILIQVLIAVVCLFLIRTVIVFVDLHKKKQEPLFKELEVYNVCQGTENSVSQKVEIKLDGRMHILLKDYYFEVKIANAKETILMTLEIRSTQDRYEIRIKNSCDASWQLSANGRIITEKFMKLNKSQTDLYLTKPHEETRMIKLYFGGKR